MGPYLRSVGNIMLEAAPEEWIGALFVTLMLALVLTGAHTLCRRWVQDTTWYLVGFAMIANITAIVMAAGYFQLYWKGTTTRTSPPRHDFGPSRPPIAPTMTRIIIEEADTNRDGFISSDEAVAASTRFVRENDVNGKGGLDYDTLQDAVRIRVRRSRESFLPPQPAPDGTKGSSDSGVQAKPAGMLPLEEPGGLGGGPSARTR